MTRVRPFRALRYDPSRVDPDRVIAPPFDVVAPADRERLWARDEHGAVRLVLTRTVDEEKDATYVEVGERLRRWRADGILCRDPEPAFYGLRQRFVDPEGRERTREGFFAALHLEDYERRIVLPHERTMAGPKADRLKLLHAARANLSAVFFLYEDRENALEAALGHGDETLLVATDDAGIRHELVRITAPDAAATIAAFLESVPVVIADGHHRYETALRYRDEMRAEGAVDDAAPHEWTLGYFSNAYSEGTLLRPIHRVIRKAPAPTEAAWRERLPGWRHETWAVEGVEDVPVLLARHLAPHHGRPAFAADDGSGTLHVFVRSEVTSDLSVRVIHEEVVGGVFGLDDDDVREGALAFPKDTLETARMVRDGRGAVALYLNALAPEDVFRVTAAGELMPQKSTFYHPKLPTGLVFRVHDP